VFWDSHNPVTRPISRQYMSIIFYHTDEQRQLAEESLARQKEQRDRRFYTQVMPAGTFTQAEDYHQKYILQHEPELWAEIQAIYPEMEDLVASTAAARINGYLDGYGSVDQFGAEIDGLGLSDAGRELLSREAGFASGN
jgi:peptide-methionine (S)-S-oxide reductase